MKNLVYERNSDTLTISSVTGAIVDFTKITGKMPEAIYFTPDDYVQIISLMVQSILNREPTFLGIPVKLTTTL